MAWSERLRVVLYASGPETRFPLRRRMVKSRGYSQARRAAPSAFRSHSNLRLGADHMVDRLSDSKQSYYAHEAREFLRKKLIGKHVKVQVDFICPREGKYKEHESAMVRVGNQNVSVGENLVFFGACVDLFVVTLLNNSSRKDLRVS
jgi:endonuclease YncB( thermonuclease family)